jgi:serine/threonine protein kinase
MTNQRISENIKQGIDPETTYETIECIGEGSFGNVYKARLLENGEIVAVKIVKYTNDEEFDSFQV